MSSPGVWPPGVSNVSTNKSVEDQSHKFTWSNEFTWVIDLRPSGIPRDHLIKKWKDRVSSSVGETLGDFNDLRIAMSQSPRPLKSQAN
jgi:hypothetical protein